MTLSVSGRHARIAAFRRALTAPRLLLGSFLGLILVGTVGLKVLPGLYTGEGLSWIDALFTATSAVCVTGLIVVDTATHFTVWGQAFLLILIQFGGLGILTFTTLIILAVGRRLSLHHEAVTATHAEIAPEVDFRHLLRNIVRFTFLFEAAGALLLFLAWSPRYDSATAAWHAVFQAVSAFCNAGFSTFSDSMMGFRTDPTVLTVIMVLIVLGGIGFLALAELDLLFRRRIQGRTLIVSLHTKLVLGVTALLLVSGWTLFTALEWNNSLDGLPGWARLANGMFMSVTARTAGFNTVDYAGTADSTNFLTMLFMSIGGSPGSTAGGIKTTTFALIGLLALSRLRGHQVVSVRNRSVPEETIQRAVGLFVVAFGVMTLATFLYSAVEIRSVGHGQAGGAFIRHMFEAVSAFNTVGLSMGVTDGLSGTSRLVTTVLAGVRLGKRISSKLLLNYVPLGEDFSLQEMAVPEAWVGCSLRELQLPRRHSISVVAVQDILRDSIQPVPDPDALLKESDTLIVAGTESSLAQSAKLK